MRLADASESFQSDLVQREMSYSTRNGYKCLLRSLMAAASKQGLDGLREVDTEFLREWLAGRGLAASTRRTELARLKAFFNHAVGEGWIEESPAARIRPPRAKQSPTLPLERDEVVRLIEAADQQPPERAMLLLMRWGGLAIRDAATLRRSELHENGELVLRRAKTGELVTVQLPEFVVAALRSLPKREGPHFFWTGSSTPDTAAKYWRRRLAKVATFAGIADFRPHRLRDTFAVELLIADVPIHDVSMLLGHSSVQTTERYYAPWNKTRRNRLAKVVRGAHRKDPVLRLLALKKGGEAGTNGPPH